MPSAILTICPDSDTKSGSITSWLPTLTTPSRGTVAKGAAVLAGVGICYVAYQSLQHWYENWSPLDYFREDKDKDKKNNV